MQNLPAFAIGVFVAVLISTAGVGAQTPVAYVLERHGEWILNNSAAPLSPGQKLPAGGSIRRRSSSADDYITIVDMERKILDSASRNCGRGDCSGTVRLPRAAPSRSFLGSLYDATMETIFGSPVRGDSNLIRTGGLLNGVLEYKEGKVDLSSVLIPKGEQYLQGEQYLRWRTVSLAAAGQWSGPVRLGKDAIVSDLKPGLYEINRMRSNGSNFEPVGSSWVLVEPPADYEKTRASFEEMRGLTEQWGKKIQSETKRLFLQASLEKLARKTPE